MNIVQKIIGTGFLFILTIGTGIWLSNSGKPLNTLIFTIHKLIALASAVFTAIFIINLLRNVKVETLLLALIVLSALFIIVLFVSGALLSTGKPASKIILTIHAVVPILAVITLSLTIYLLAGRK